ncbi:MAG: metallophosphoesterase [Phycisphaerales bacterium]|nr:metallophosphoesterase [Phycisphaerales bacterium]
MSETTQAHVEDAGAERRGGAAPSNRGRVVRALAWLCLWLLLATTSTALHMFTWVWATPQAVLGQDSPAMKKAAGLAVLPTVPGWLIVTRLNGGLDGRSMWFAFAASAVGWMPWVGGVWCVLQVRRAVLKRGSIRRSADGASASSDVKSTATSPSPGGVDLSRRRLLVDGAGFSVGALGAGTLSGSVLVAPWSVGVRQFVVEIEGLAPEHEDLVIAFISDTHFGPRVPAEQIVAAASIAARMRPDIYVLGGDYIHNGPTYAEGAAALLEPVISSGNCVAVLGNHDNYFGATEAVVKALTKHGAVVLRNQTVYVDRTLRIRTDAPPTGEAALALTGMADLWTEASDARGALRGVDERTPRVIISHNPDLAEHADFVRGTSDQPKLRADLMLSGHTHGGQVRLPLIGQPIVPSDYGQKYVSGLAISPGGFPVITSNGVGVSILPLRFNVPAEVLKIRLKRKRSG